MRGREDICPTKGATVVTTNTVIISANDKRNRLVMFTAGAKDVWLSEGGAPVVGEGLVLKADCGSSMTWDRACNNYRGEIRGTSSDGSAVSVSWREGN